MRKKMFKRMIQVFSIAVIIIILIFLSFDETAEQFSDYNSKHWANENINFVVENNISKGYPDGTFRPDDPITRIEYLIITLRTIDVNLEVCDGFPWYKNYLDEALKRGIILNDEFTIQSLEEPILRSEMALFIDRSLNLEEPDDLDAYIKLIPDYDTIPVKYRNMALKAYATGMITGKDGNFDPNGIATRAEAATMMRRARQPEYRKPIILSEDIDNPDYFQTHDDYVLLDTNPKIDLFDGFYANEIPLYDGSTVFERNINFYLENSNIKVFDFKNSLNELYNLNFHDSTVFPMKEYLPSEYDPEKVMQWGFSNVLDISKLHKEGITGKGVNIAYVDQPLRITHENIKEANIYYEWSNYLGSTDTLTSMHGISVAGLIVGDQIGAAPDANLYFIGHPAYFADQRSHAEAIERILEINRTLPACEKIKVIGFSDNPDSREEYIEAFEEMVDKANDVGILVLFANNQRALIKPYADRNNPNSYSADGAKTAAFPATYTLPNGNRDDHYMYHSFGGTSWTTPVEISLVAMALQVNPLLDVFTIESLMDETAYVINDGKIINPVAFIERVNSEKPDKFYYYSLIYNSEYTTVDDFKAISAYGMTLEKDDTIVNYVDVKDNNNAISIYNKLKKYNENTDLFLKGIQIIGTADEVDAFEIHDKVDMKSFGTHDLGTIVTDHFYSNFNNDPNLLNEQLSMYKVFSENIDIDFFPQWEVSRLPLQKGEISTYYEKYRTYKKQTYEIQIPLVNFSNPIFASSRHIDDLSYFISERLDNDLKIIHPNNYRIYGNQKGYYPVETDVLGGFTRENLSKENDRGIMNLVINSHGQSTNIDNAYYQNESSDSEQRESLVNNTNVNEVLDNNYYNLYLWDCWGGAELKSDTIGQTMIDDGKAINIVASSYITSNNGFNVFDSLEDLKSNNGVSLFYFMVKYLYQDELSWSESFFNAKNAYIRYSLENIDDDGNYQFNLNNALAIHHYGLIEETNKIKSIRNLDELIYSGKSITTNEIKNASIEIKNAPYIDKSMITDFEYKDDLLNYQKISIQCVDNHESLLSYAGVAQDELNYYFKIKYTIDSSNRFLFFLAGDKPGLKVFTKTIHAGDGTVIIGILKSDFEKFESNIIINTGDSKFHLLKYCSTL